MPALKNVKEQKIPTQHFERQKLQEKGQFWTPQWLAEVMASWVAQDDPLIIFDPAVGPGTFFAAARTLGYKGDFSGFELHSEVLEGGAELELDEKDFLDVRIADFIDQEIPFKFPAIISNPPYIRHHRLTDKRKSELKIFANDFLGFSLDGRVGLHVFFLLKCLHLLPTNGRLAFLLPADVCEGVSSNLMWKRISEMFRIEAILTFSETAAPFPQVDTNAMVFLISKKKPANKVKWLQILKKNREVIIETLQNTSSADIKSETIIVVHRELEEALQSGFSRPPRINRVKSHALSNFASVMRGVATGANELFFLTKNEMQNLCLDEKYFCRAIGRTRDCNEAVLSEKTLSALEIKNRPTWLLNLQEESIEELPLPLKKHLEKGVEQGFSTRSLIKTRRPWYKMEKRTPPPMLFAYLGRRDLRFILNEAAAIPLTGFLCIYPHDVGSTKLLWKALNHPETIKNLSFIGKSYGKGAIKVEPRQLDSLEIPESVLNEFGLLKNGDQ